MVPHLDTGHAEDRVVPVGEQALAPAAMPDPAVSVAASRVSAAQQALLSPWESALLGEKRRALGLGELPRFTTCGRADLC